jgi:hypothetical protein
VALGYWICLDLHHCVSFFFVDNHEHYFDNPIARMREKIYE